MEVLIGGRKGRWCVGLGELGVKEDGEHRWEAKVGGEEGMKWKDKRNGELQMRQPFSFLNEQLPLVEPVALRARLACSFFMGDGWFWCS